MTEAHIYIYGIISAEDTRETKKYGRVGLKDVVSQMQAGKDAELFKVHIRSEGGDVNEGIAIHDALIGSGKTIETIGEGIVASIATVVFLAGSKRIMSQGSEFTIHNPWAEVKGSAADFQRNADGLLEVENALAMFYNKYTGVNIDILKDLMSKETTLTSDQAKNYGFATDVMTTLKAVALFNNQKSIQMTKEEIDSKMDEKFNGFFDKIKNLFSKAKNLTVTAGDGSILDFGDQIQDPSEIAVGMTATIDGTAADGDYTMPDGAVLTFVSGAITVIVPAQGDGMAELKAENEQLKQQLADAQAQASTLKADSEKQFKTFEKEINNFKAQIKSDVAGFAKKIEETDDEPEVRKAFK